MRALAPWLAEYPRSRELDDAYRLDLLVRHGLPSSLRGPLETANRVAVAFGCVGRVMRCLDEGEILEFAQRSWVTHHRPGHSIFDTVFHDAGSGILIGGDHLMERVPAVPFLTRPLEGDPTDAVPTVFLTYLESLARTEAMELECILPGHGPAFADHRSIVARRRTRDGRKLAEIAAVLEPGARSAFEIAQEVRRDSRRRTRSSRFRRSSATSPCWSASIGWRSSTTRT